jgi:glutamine amidotransferase-like protein
VFALARYEPDTRQLTLCNDRLGFRPLYTLDTPDWFAYASEVKALLAIVEKLPPLDDTALRCGLNCVYGAVLFGGSKLAGIDSNDWPSFPGNLLRSQFFENPFFSLEEVVERSLPDVRDSLQGPSYDCFQLSQRQRRCTLYGHVALAAHCELSLPTTALPIIELFLASLTDDQRRNSRFYSKFLASRYPAYFPQHSMAEHRPRAQGAHASGSCPEGAFIRPTCVRTSHWTATPRHRPLCPLPSIRSERQDSGTAPGRVAHHRRHPDR